MGKDRRRNSVKANKPSTSKSIDKITFCPKKHEQKFVKNFVSSFQPPIFQVVWSRVSLSRFLSLVLGTFF